MNNIIVSILGQRLDNVGFGSKRWFRWRPTMSLLMHHDFPVDELVLIHHKDDLNLASLTMRDVNTLCLDIKITTYVVDYSKTIIN